MPRPVRPYSDRETALALELRAQGLSFVDLEKRIPASDGEHLTEHAVCVFYPLPEAQYAKASELGMRGQSGLLPPAWFYPEGAYSLVGYKASSSCPAVSRPFDGSVSVKRPRSCSPAKTRARETYAAALALRAQGLSFSAIGRKLGRARTSVTVLLERAVRAAYPDPAERAAKAAELGLGRDVHAYRRDTLHTASGPHAGLMPGRRVEKSTWTPPPEQVG